MEENDVRRAEQLELLNQALQQQRRSVRCFELMLAAANKREDKRMLSAMQREDRRHFYLLEGIYEEIAGHAYRPPRLAVAMPRVVNLMRPVWISFVQTQTTHIAVAFAVRVLPNSAAPKKPWTRHALF